MADHDQQKLIEVDANRSPDDIFEVSNNCNFYINNKNVILL